MEHTYEFRRCRKSDISEISNLVNYVLGTNRTHDYWEWKYFKNPARQALSALALINGRVVGQIGAIPVRFSVMGREVAGAQELDVAMFEDHRRFDVFLKMVSMGKEILLKDNIRFSYGLTNELTSEIVQTLMPKKRISPIPRLVKILDVGPILRQRFSIDILSRIISLPANIALLMRYPKEIVIPNGMQLKRIHRFDERFDTFWNRIKEDYPIMTVRDSAYLNWRYVDAPHIDYKIFCLEQMGSNEITGFVVFGERVVDASIGQIFDIVTPRTENGIIDSCLLRFVLNRFRKKKVAVVRCWMFSHSHVYPELIKIGFVPREQKGRDFVFQDINMQDPAIPQDIVENRENWYLTKGDSDID